MKRKSREVFRWEGRRQGWADGALRFVGSGLAWRVSAV